MVELEVGDEVVDDSERDGYVREANGARLPR